MRCIAAFTGGACWRDFLQMEREEILFSTLEKHIIV